MQPMAQVLETYAGFSALHSWKCLPSFPVHSGALRWKQRYPYRDEAWGHTHLRSRVDPLIDEATEAQRKCV